MWFDIFKIQQGSFTTLIPKNMPKIREDTPCRDRLKRIMKKINDIPSEDSYVYDLIHNKTSSFFDKIGSEYNSTVSITKNGKSLPPAIALEFQAFKWTRIDKQNIDEIPEDVCCAFLKYLEKQHDLVRLALRNHVSFDKPLDKKEYKGWKMSGSIEHGPVLLGYEGIISGEMGRQIKLEIDLSDGKSPLYNISIPIVFEIFFVSPILTDAEVDFIHTHMETTVQELFDNWLRGDFYWADKTPRWITKKEVGQWFSSLDIMWWLK